MTEFIIVLVLIFGGWISGLYIGEMTERERLEAKCLTSQQAKPYADAVALCKEQVK